MSVYEKIIEIGRNFNHNTFILFTSDGKTGRIIDFTADPIEAKDYVRIAKKNGIKVEIAEYDTAEKSVYFHEC